MARKLPSRQFRKYQLRVSFIKGKILLKPGFFQQLNAFGNALGFYPAKPDENAVIFPGRSGKVL